MSVKPLHNTTTAGARAAGSDVQVTGNPDVWVLLCKASSQSQGWMKSTKVMNLPGGCLVQVTSEFRNTSGIVAAATDELAFVPGTWITDDGDGPFLTGRYPDSLM